MRFERALRPTSVKCTVAAMGSMAVAWAGSSPALAQSAPPPPRDRFAARFNGWSFGAGGGYSIFHANPEAASINAKGPDFLSADLVKRDWLAVVEAGREFQHGNYVFGLFGDGQFGSQSVSFASSQSVGSPTHSELKLGNGASITGHAGFVINEMAQLYGLRLGIPPI